MLLSNVTLASNVTLWRNLPRAARAALSGVIKCGKIGTDFFISVSSQGTANVQRDSENLDKSDIQRRLIKRFRFPHVKFCFVL